MKKFSHIDEQGKVKMVDVSDKSVSERVAIASAKVFLKSEVIELLRSRQNPKGDPLEVARIAGIMAAKKTFEIIPLCHQINLSSIKIQAEIRDYGVYIEAEVKANEKTGVEMEALTAVSVASLTVYDMCKALQKDIEIGEVRLELKTGGRSGEFSRGVKI
ncbi:MAG: cyclic pyranopterin monophosphate synthase MoaC [Pyrinomonadaceae bacterium]|nr:cyclic pyranopterin monophosphate synthase MoaC [Pyrinomonadaceae bacterium]MCX7640526.1 cyclic pyranopterin monophosphate synthase MoaC [Pyrinomonadaceae bacterium]MDW8303893.1 cyclic pyranopterin monophosphate synthase MoaC [Acidobacteriota bacterium]